MQLDHLEARAYTSPLNNLETKLQTKNYTLQQYIYCEQIFDQRKRYENNRHTITENPWMIHGKKTETAKLCNLGSMVSLSY
jgi:hypothetical protein